MNTLIQVAFSGRVPHRVYYPASLRADQHVVPPQQSAARLHRGRLPSHCQTHQTDYHVHYYR